MNFKALGTVVASLAAVSGLGFLLARSKSTEPNPTELKANAAGRATRSRGRAFRTTSAAEMARVAGVNPKSFRQALRDENNTRRGSASQTTSAAEMARAAGIDPKVFRQALRDENLPWHRHNDPWIVFVRSPEHKDMQRVLASLTRP